MSQVAYNRGLYRVSKDGWEQLDLNIILLVTRADTEADMYDPDLNVLSDLLGLPGVEEMAGTGYARQGLNAPTVVEDDAANRTVWDTDDAVFVEIDAGVALACVLWIESTTDFDDDHRDLLGFYDEGFPKPTNGGDLTVAPPSTGWLYAAQVA